MHQHDLSWADADHGHPAFLSEIFGLAFVRNVAPLDALRRIGGLEDTLASRTPAQMADLHNYDDGYPEVASALALGEWTVLVQPNGFWLAHLVDALSRGTEAVTILRHDYASPRFTHAVDGTVTTTFHLNWPGDRGGTDPDRLLPLIREAGFDPDTDDDDENWQDRYEDAMTHALRLTGLVTGVLPTYEQITGPLPSTHFDHWFSRTRPSDVGDALAMATGLVAELELGGTPGLAAALAAAGRGEPVVVTPDSDLGRHVREWSTLARRASWSLNLEKSRMGDEERSRGFRFGHLTQALAAAFRADLA